MVSQDILIDDIGKVRFFYEKIALLECDVEIYQNRYIVNGKSILGILSLDLSKPVELRIDSNSLKVVENFLDEISELLVSS